MKTFFYDKNAINVFKSLKRQIPNRIFSDNYGIRVVFDYMSFHIAVYSNVFTAASQNKYDEVIVADFQSIDSVFQPNESDLLLFENNLVSRLWILRTMLYFTDCTPYGSEVDPQRDSEINAEPNPAIADLMRKCIGGYSEVVCHPESTEAKSVNQKFTNLVDAGIMLEIDNQLLTCFSCHNSFGIVGSIMQLDEIEEDIIPFMEKIRRSRRQ